VELGIDSVSLNPDSVLDVIDYIAKTEGRRTVHLGCCPVVTRILRRLVVRILECRFQR
jgi:hypothetical protein